VRAWLRDPIDQIAIGEFLARSKISCGQRFALIAVDNSIEFMLIAYVEAYRQLVGGHKPGGIPKNEWRKIKGGFESLLSKICGLEPDLSQYEDEINRYHNLRNALYHSGSPTTVSSSRVMKYSKIARDVLSILFSIRFDKKEWEDYLSRIGCSLCSPASSPEIRRSVSYEQVNDLVRFSTDSQVSAKEAISLALHGFAILTGATPHRDSLLKSVAMSGYPITSKVLAARLSDLRKQRLIRKKHLQLTAKGLKVLQKKFIL